MANLNLPKPKIAETAAARASHEADRQFLDDMTKPKEVIRDLSFALCGVCGGEHDCGFGYTPNDQSRIMWTCRECIPIAEQVYGMARKDMSKYREDAIRKGGEEAGAYLEKLDRPAVLDVFRLITPEEWFEFLATFDTARARELRRLMADCAPPF